MDIKMILKLSKILAKFSEIKTDKAVLTINGELEIGAEVYTYDEAGEIVPAADGEYVAEDERVIVIAEGKVTEIKEKEEEVIEEPAAEEPAAEEEHLEEEAAEETVEEPSEEPAEEEIVEDEKDAKIKELLEVIAQKDEQIALLEAQLAELAKPLEEPVKMSKTLKVETEYSNPALKYFEK